MRRTTAFVSLAAFLVVSTLGATDAAAADAAAVAERLVFTRHGDASDDDLAYVAADPAAFLPIFAGWLEDGRIDRAHADRAQMPALANLISLLNLCGPDGWELLREAWTLWAQKRDALQKDYDAARAKLLKQLGKNPDPAKVDPKVTAWFAEARRPIATYAALDRDAVQALGRAKYAGLEGQVLARLLSEPVLVLDYIDYLDAAAEDRAKVEGVLRQLLQQTTDPRVKERIERWLKKKK